MAGQSAIHEVISRNLTTGQDIIQRSAASPIYLDGRVIGAVAVNTDITENKRTEHALRDAIGQLSEARDQLEQRVQERTASLEMATRELETLAGRLASEQRFLSSIMDNVPAAITYLDEHLIYQQCNQAAAHEFGIPVEQVLGRHLYDIVPGNPQLWAAVESVLNTGQPFRSPVLTVRWENRTAAESVRHYIVAYLPDMDESGRVLGVFAEGQDVSESVQLHEQLEQMQVELEHQVAEQAEANVALAQRDETLQALSRRLVELQERERSYLADRLYNEVAQVLAALKLQMGTLERNLERLPASTDRLSEMTDKVDSVLRELHQLATQLRPASLDQLGLVAALRQYVTEFGGAHGLEVQFAACDDLTGVRMRGDAEIALYRIAQEALANVARHAHATLAEVIITCHDQRVALVVGDNGIGFDAEAASVKGGLGLVGMRERIEALGGCLSIETTAGVGTNIFAEMPLHNAR